MTDRLRYWFWTRVLRSLARLAFYAAKIAALSNRAHDELLRLHVRTWHKRRAYEPLDYEDPDTWGDR
jgi:hypothetical protein